MHWVAPSEKDAATGTLEKRLWAAADQLRANSGLTSQQYSLPVLGLIFLRFAEVRFAKRRAELLPSPSGRGAGGEGAADRRRVNRADDPTAYHAEGVLYLSEKARFATLLNLPEGADVGKAVNDAMADIEKQNPQLAGVLPRTYQVFTSTLLKELLKKASDIPASLDYDAFGRVYEYFLGEFARTEGSKGGEFYTPSSIVRLIVEILEPYHGRVLDPACGSGGMFVQSARFVTEHKKSASAELSIAGQEKVAATANLCRMNLAVHGLEGDIKQAITYYEDLHQSAGRFDFVLANPPFNVDAVDKERLAAEVGPGRRFPFGLPRTDNANYLWIQLFYSALNAKGRAGFVMANSASDARSSEQELRRQLIESRAVDVMVAVGPNLFYTVTLPCTLWFFDNAKAKLPPSPPSPLPAGEGRRGEAGAAMRGGYRFSGLAERARQLRKKQTQAEAVLWEVLRDRQFENLKFRREHQVGDYLVDFYCHEHLLVVECDGGIHDTNHQKKHDKKRDAYLRSLGMTVIRFPNDDILNNIEAVLAKLSKFLPSPGGRRAGDEGLAEGGTANYAGARYSDTVLFVDARHIFRQIDRAHREWTPAQIGFIANLVRLYRGEELDFTLGGDEARAKFEEIFGLPSPSGRRAGDEGIALYRDVPGLCKAATIREIEQQGWSLNPGRYVGVAAGEAVSDEDFKEQLETLNEELEALNAAARELETTIASNVSQILEA